MNFSGLCCVWGPGATRFLPSPPFLTIMIMVTNHSQDSLNCEASSLNCDCTYTPKQCSVFTCSQTLWRCMAMDKRLRHHTSLNVPTKQWTNITLQEWHIIKVKVISGWVILLCSKIVNSDELQFMYPANDVHYLLKLWLIVTTVYNDVGLSSFQTGQELMGLKRSFAKY